MNPKLIRRPRRVLFLLTTCAAEPVAHAADAERIVVMNAHLMGRSAPSEDVRVANAGFIDGISTLRVHRFDDDLVLFR